MSFNAHFQIEFVLKALNSSFTSNISRIHPHNNPLVWTTQQIKKRLNWYHVWECLFGIRFCFHLKFTYSRRIFCFYRSGNKKSSVIRPWLILHSNHRQKRFLFCVLHVFFRARFACNRIQGVSSSLLASIDFLYLRLSAVIIFAAVNHNGI
jgi:hypothetical protein